MNCRPPRPARIPLLCCFLLVPRALAAQCPEGTPPPCASGPAGPAPTSVAVLYFDNLSRDSGDAYLADGMTEELISRLGQVERLQVKSRTAVQALRDRARSDPAALGRTLGVLHLVSGSVRRAGPRLRVTVELTRAATGVSMWSRTFDRPAADLLGVQAEIAESVAVSVGGRLAPADRRRLEARPTVNAAAYDHYLRGNFELERRTTASILRAAREYEEAVRLDPRFAPALAQIGVVYWVLSASYYAPEIGISRESLLARSRSALDRSLRLDSTSAEAWMARATTFANHSDAAYGDALAHAIAADPRSAVAHHQYALYQRDTGHDSLAVRELRLALALEPDRAISLENLGIVFVVGRQFAEGARWIDSAVALRPDAPFFYVEQALVRLQLGDTAGARRSAELAREHGGADNREEIVAMLESRVGDSAAARARLAPLDSALGRRDCHLSFTCLELAYALVAAGAREQALAIVERMTPRSSWLLYWTRRAEFDPIRADPRFQLVVEESRRR